MDRSQYRWFNVLKITKLEMSELCQFVLLQKLFTNVFVLLLCGVLVILGHFPNVFFMQTFTFLLHFWYVN